MVLSASSVVALDDYGSSWYVVTRQAMWLAVGTAACVVVLRVDYHRWRRLAAPALVVSGVLLALVLVPGVGLEVNGASRWLGYGPLSLQPSELAKLTLLLFVADLLARRAAWMDDARLTLVPVTVVFGAIAVLADGPAEPRHDARPRRHRALAALGGRHAAPPAHRPWPRPVRSSPPGWRCGRRTGAPACSPSSTRGPTTRTPATRTSSRSSGSRRAGITGTGLGESRAKWGFLPDAHTDFIFAIIGEELGLIGALVVVALFVALCVLGVARRAARARTASACCSRPGSPCGSACRPSSTSAP